MKNESKVYTVQNYASKGASYNDDLCGEISKGIDGFWYHKCAANGGRYEAYSTDKKLTTRQVARQLLAYAAERVES